MGIEADKPDLDLLLSVLRKYDVAEFQDATLSIKLNPKPQAKPLPSGTPDITSTPNKTAKELADEILFYSAR